MNYLLASYFVSVLLALFAGWHYFVQTSWHSCITAGNLASIILVSLVPVVNTLYALWIIALYLASLDVWSRVIWKKYR